MITLLKLEDNVFTIVENGIEIFYGDKIDMEVEMHFLDIEAEEVKMALNCIEQYKHNAASFGIRNKFVFTYNHENKAA